MRAQIPNIERSLSIRIQSRVMSTSLPDWHVLTVPLWHFRIQSGRRPASLPTDVSLQFFYGTIIIDIIYVSMYIYMYIYNFIRTSGNGIAIMET